MLGVRASKRAFNQPLRESYEILPRAKAGCRTIFLVIDVGQPVARPPTTNTSPISRIGAVIHCQAARLTICPSLSAMARSANQTSRVGSVPGRGAKRPVDRDPASFRPADDVLLTPIRGREDLPQRYPLLSSGEGEENAGNRTTGTEAGESLREWTTPIGS